MPLRHSCWRAIALAALVAFTGSSLAQGSSQRLLDLEAQQARQADQQRRSDELSKEIHRREVAEHRRRIAEIKSKLANCRGCAERDSLQSELDSLEDLYRTEEERKQHRLERAAQSGSTESIAELARFLVNVRTSWRQACPLFEALSRRGHDASIAALSNCFHNVGDASYRQLSAALVPACADRGFVGCQWQMAAALVAAETPSMGHPAFKLPADDRRALVYIEAAARAAPTESTHAVVAAIRQRLGLPPAVDLPPVPPPRGQAAPLPPSQFDHPSFWISGRDARGRPVVGNAYITVRADGRYTVLSGGVLGRPGIGVLEGDHFTVDYGDGVEVVYRREDDGTLVGRSNQGKREETLTPTNLRNKRRR